MNRILRRLVLLVFLLSILTCLTPPEPEPLIVEEVKWEDLADKDSMKNNDNRYVSFNVQFLGTDVEGVASQMLYGQIADVILLNHLSQEDSYENQMTTSLDSFLIGFPAGKDTDDLMVNTEFGKVIRIIGRTEYVEAGFGLFKHLLVRVEDFEVIDK